MLDILHYYFEEFFLQPSGEAAERNSIARKTIYQTLYNTEYKYEVGGSSGAASNEYNYEDDDDDSDIIPESIKPFDPVRGPAKPYTPATKMTNDSTDPYAGILDAPIR